MYPLPKIHKRLVNASGRPAISNCGSIPTDNALPISRPSFLASYEVGFECETSDF